MPLIGQSRERALRQIGELTLPLLDKLGEDVPFVVETPGGKAGHARDIATLKELR